MLSFLNSIKQFCNISVSSARGYVEVDCVVNVSNTNAAKVFRVNVSGYSQVKQTGQHSGLLVGGGRAVAWFRQISRGRGVRSCPGNSDVA